MFKKHEIYIFVLSFLALSIKTYSTPFFVPCLATFMGLVIYYALRFNLSELLWEITIVLLLVSLCLIVGPGENPNRVEWVNFGGESLKLSNGQNIRTSEDVKIGDIVDYNGKVILRGNRAVYFLPNMRLQIYNNAFKNIDYPISSLIAGCRLGVRRDIPQSIRTYFVLSGCYHYLAISGLHVGIFIALLSFVLKILRFKKPLSMASILTSHAIPLTGMPPSAVRAYLFFSLLSSHGYENYRNVPPLYITGLIFLILILLCKLSIGMVLSFLAVCDIILTYDKKDSWLKKLTTISISPFCSHCWLYSIGLGPLTFYRQSISCY